MDVGWEGGGGGGGLAVYSPAAFLVRDVKAFMSDGLPWCWMSQAELKASGTHCYGNIAVSVFRLRCTVR